MTTARLTLNILVVIGVVAFLASIRAGIDPAEGNSSTDGVRKDQGAPAILGRDDRSASMSETAWRQPDDLPATAPARFHAIGNPDDATSKDLKAQLSRAIEEGAALVIGGVSAKQVAADLDAALPVENSRSLGGFKLVYVGHAAEFQQLLDVARARNVEVQWVPVVEG